MKICRTCKARFEASRPWQTWCSPEHGAEQAKQKLEAVRKKAQIADKKATKSRLRVLDETLSKLRKLAQDAFNAYCRARDDKLPCVCCGKWPKAHEALTGGAWDAGHFRGRGANPELAFNEDNCHKQLKSCNRGDWDRVAYENELIRRIGPERVAILKGPHPPKHYTREDLKAIRAEYLAKAKQLKKENA